MIEINKPIFIPFLLTKEITEEVFDRETLLQYDLIFGTKLTRLKASVRLWFIKRRK